jgi:hypothetical protein
VQELFMPLGDARVPLERALQGTKLFLDTLDLVLKILHGLFLAEILEGSEGLRRTRVAAADQVTVALIIVHLLVAPLIPHYGLADWKILLMSWVEAASRQV